MCAPEDNVRVLAQHNMHKGKFYAACWYISKNLSSWVWVCYSTHAFHSSYRKVQVLLYNPFVWVDLTTSSSIATKLPIKRFILRVYAWQQCNHDNIILNCSNDSLLWQVQATIIFLELQSVLIDKRKCVKCGEMWCGQKECDEPNKKMGRMLIVALFLFEKPIKCLKLQLYWIKIYG